MFRSIPSYPNYEINECGEVRRISTQRILSAAKNQTYPKVNVGKTRPVHLLVAEAFFGKCPTGYEVDHIDGNSRNYHVSNLRYITRSANRRNRSSWKWQQERRGIRSRDGGFEVQMNPPGQSNRSWGWYKTLELAIQRRDEVRAFLGKPALTP